MISILKPYKNISKFLHRFTILKVGTLHIRIHKLVGKDVTTLYHNHPFDYVTVVLWGGYRERVLNGADRVLKLFRIYRGNHNRYHRIEEVKPNTVTLFIAYGKYDWNAVNKVIDTDGDGIHLRFVNDIKVYAKKENGIWFIGNKIKEIAEKETRHSIHQVV